MDCIAQTQQWFYLCLTLCGVILALLAMFFGYNLTLSGRTTKLEKKNGKELAELEKVKKRLDKIEQGGKHE